uniref:Uncharacterized protein n=1 Tax=Sinocyclocheilus anshuiensis TaxID=1608454 RepID=A0A671SKT9_9TELE
MRILNKPSSLKIMAMVRSSLQKVMLFLQHIQRMAVTSPRYQKLCKVKECLYSITLFILRRCILFRSYCCCPRRHVVKALGYLQCPELSFKLSRSFREFLEAGVEKWTGLIAILEELWFWVKLKDEELTKQRPVGEDVHTLLQKQGYCTVSHAVCERGSDIYLWFQNLYYLVFLS